MTPSERIITLGRESSRDLTEFTPSGLVHTVYNPLEYASAPWEEYIRRYGNTKKRVVFMGMNPGPWGMAQTGIPFGEVAVVTDWLHIAEHVGRPAVMHPKRPVQGLACKRSEVSGRRLWGLFQDRFGTAEVFFQDHMVLNYCPLVFMADSGRNITPDRLPKAERDTLFAICNRFLVGSLAALQPEIAVGVGKFATARLEEARRALGQDLPDLRVTGILHPSPASPAANRGWTEAATGQLVDAGVWSSSSTTSE